MEFPEKRAEKALRHDAAAVTEDDLDRVLSKRERIEKKIREHPRLAGFADRLKLLYALLRDYARGEYREVPWGTVASIAAALLYVLNPMDMLPDFVPFFGFIDDATVMAFCLRMVSKDLDKYQQYLKEHDE